MEDLPPPEQWYPYPEFLEDLNASIGAKSEELFGYFVRRYPTPLIRNFRVPRLIAAAMYLTKHYAELNRGSLGVIGKNVILMTGRVHVGLWIHWARPEIDPKTYDPPVEEFISTCENLPGDNPP